MRALRPAAIVYHSVILMALALGLGVSSVAIQLRAPCAMPPTFEGFFFNMSSGALFMCSPVIVGAAVKWWAYRRSDGLGIRAYGWLYLALTLACCLAFAAVVSAPYEGFDGYAEFYSTECGL